MIQLNAHRRTLFGKKTAGLRARGFLPAVIYGGKEKSATLSVPTREFMKVWKTAGESTLIDLSVDGAGKKSVLIHEVAFDPIKSEPLHVDFFEAVSDRPLKTRVALLFQGESEAVKSLGGVLLKVMHELEVEALPKDLPRELVVDIACLATFDDHILLKDIIPPKGVTLFGEPDSLVAKVNPPRTDEELADLTETQATDLEAIEVAKKGKKEEAPEGTEVATGE